MSGTRILSISPHARSVGYALLEGVQLIDWGIRSLAPRQGTYPAATRSLDLIEALVDRYEPQVVVLPALDRLRLSRARLVRAVRSILGTRQTPVVSSSVEAVWACLSPLAEADRPTQYVVMRSVACLFPELEPLLPRPRRPWESRDYWAPMFDAVARAVGWLYDAGQRKGLGVS